MNQPLVPCPVCRRHVRASESACPFCAQALPSDLGRRAIPGLTQRLGRGAAFVFASSIVVAGCGGKEETTPTVTDAASTDTGKTGVDTGSGVDTGPVDTGNIFPPYGIPPVDSGPPDEGGSSADYGAPPVDGGGGGAEYGAPPPPKDAG